ncbi:MAG: 6-phosphogluconolactonase [Breznakia sp.]
MKITYVEDYEELSNVCKNMLVDELKIKASANFCLASGASPKKAIQKFVEEIKKENIDSTSLFVTKLDEWIGIEKDDKDSCEKFLRDLIIDPLAMGDENFMGMNPATKNVEEEIARMDELLQNRPIDVCVLGLGMNGHLGLNEPAKTLHNNSFAIDLDVKTRTHDMIKERDITRGMSVGMGQIMRSKKVILLITGSKKDEVIKQFFTENISTNLPASFLWLHPNVDVIVDRSVFK